MALREELQKQGNWLFRWRSYLPLFLVVFFLLALGRLTDPFETRTPERLWELASFSVSMIGVVIRIIAVGSAPQGTSGRNVDRQEAKALNTTGLYSAVRHPLYLGNFVIWLGASLVLRSAWLPASAGLVLWMYYERIMFAEEEFLREKFGREYLDWANRTPAVIPNFRLWKTPVLPFSFRCAIRKECSGIFGVISAFTVLDLASETMRSGRLSLDPVWAVLFAAGLAFYLTAVVLKKKTNVLQRRTIPQTRS